MPSFEGYSEVDVDIEDFLSACSSREIKELIDCLKEDGYLEDYIKELKESDSSSLIESEFTEMVFKLKDLYLQISNDDLQAIKNVVNKY
jgi:DNA-directed RNA polymerase specialized sigma54-like protein